MTGKLIMRVMVSEAVIFPSNKKSRELSNKILNEISKDFGVFNRGVKEHGATEKRLRFF